MTDPTRKTLDYDGGQFSYLEWDRSRPALHFAHANGFNCEVYRALLSPLTQFQIFASDMRGHGFTTLPAPLGMPNKWAVFGHDLNAFLNLMHPGPLILAGHSMGAIASLMVAAQHPDRVKALVLVEPVLIPGIDYFRGQLRRLAGIKPQQPNLADRAQRRREIYASFDEVFYAYRGRGAFQTWPEETLRDYLRGGLLPTGNGTEVRLACAPSWEAENFRSGPPGISRLARQLRCPLTLIVGENGTASEQEVANITRLHKPTRVVRVPGATHFLPMERPDIVREEIDRIAHPSRAL